MRSFRRLLTAAIALGGCGDQHGQASREIQARFFRIQECDVPPPPSVTYEISAKVAVADGVLKFYLRNDIPDAYTVTIVGPTRETGWTDRFGKHHKPIRIYFVPNKVRPARGAIWVIYDHVVGVPPRRQVLALDLDRTKNIVRVDGRTRDTAFVPYRIAILHRATEIGPTFVSGYPQRPYERQEYDSPRTRAEWERSSGCGGAPLSAVPKSWTEERNRQRAVSQRK